MNYRSILLAWIAVAPGLASAQSAYSVDAEFVRPTYGNDSLAGVDVATARKPFTFRFGAQLMYTRDPVTLWDRVEDTELGAVVTDRFGLLLGASFDISNRLTVNALIPAAVNSGSDPGDPKDFAAPGFGMQDIGVGARLAVLRSDPFNLGIRAGVVFPSGRSLAYLGDSGFRPHGGLLASVHVGRTMIAGDFGVMIRPDSLETDEDFTAGTELNVNLGLRHKLPDATRLGLTAQVMSKAGFNNFLGGGGENALEALGGIEIYPSRHVVLDLQGGRGLTEGYATTDLRVIGGLRIEFVPKEAIAVIPPPPIPPPVVPPPPIPEPEDPPPPVLDNDVLTVTDDAIVIKDRIEFIVNTTTLMGSSRPVLRGIADYLNGTQEVPAGVELYDDKKNPNFTSWKIRHLEIVGHASEEGSYEYNYDLSQGRARTVWQTLIEMGVHPKRVSHKGMGEVVPRDAAKLGRELTEQELQDNRRVEFHIIRQYDELEEAPFDDFKSTIKAPWSGQVIRVKLPAKPPPPPDDNSLDDQDDVDEFEQPFDLDDLDEGMEDEGMEEDTGEPGGEK